MKEPCLHVSIDLMRTHTLGVTALDPARQPFDELHHGGAADPAAAACGRAAADYLQGRGQLRRNRRHRDRPAGQLRSQPDQGRLSGLRAGQAADRVGRVARRHPGREVRPAALQDQADRARRPQQPEGVRRPRLRHRARRPQHELLALGAREAGRPSIHRALPRCQRRRGDRADRRREIDGAGVHRQPRAPAARREQLHGPEGTVGHARADRRILPDARHGHHRPAARSERGDSRLQGAEHVHGPQERRELHGRYSRPSQGGRLLQRRNRLRHLRSDQQHLRDRHQAVQPGCDCRRHARQRQLLRGRPSGPVRLRRRGRDCVSVRTTRRSASACPPCSANITISQDSLRTLSDETGGFAAVNSNDFAEELRPDHPGQQQLLRPRVLLERHQA